MILLGVLLLINICFSWINAVSCGRTWFESKYERGFIRVIVCFGFFQSGIGFTSVSFLTGILLLTAFGVIDLTYMDNIMNHWYLMTIIPFTCGVTALLIEIWNALFRNYLLVTMDSDPFYLMTQEVQRRQLLQKDSSLFNETSFNPGDAILERSIYYTLSFVLFGFYMTWLIIDHHSGSLFPATKKYKNSIKPQNYKENKVWWNL